MGLHHDGHSNENVKKTNGVLLRNCQIYDIVGQISPSYCLWSSWFVTVIEPPGLPDWAIWRQLGYFWQPLAT